MYREITIACPKCDSHFIISSEYCGGIVDCSECGTAFEVKAPSGEDGKNMQNNSASQKKSKKVKSTNTVAISRNNLGMIPELDDVKIR